MKESKRRVFLDKTFDSSLDAIIFTDGKGYIVEANHAYVELTGYKKDEIIGKHTSEFSPMKEGTYECTTGELIQIDKKFSEQLRATMKTHIEKGELQNVMGYQLRKDHTIVPVEDSMVFLIGDEGKRIGGVAIIRDNTERRKAEIEVRQAKDYLENIFMTSVDGVMVVDSEGKIAAVNKAVEKIFDCSSDQLIGKHTTEIEFYEEEHQITKQKLMDRLLSEGTISGVERTWKKPDGSSVFVEMNIALLKDDEGNITGSVGSIRDVTDRKQAEEALKKSEEKYHNLIEHANDAIVSINTPGRIIGFNKKAEQMFGYSREEVMGKPSYLLISQETKENYKEGLKQFTTTGIGIDRDNNILEGKGARKGGEEFQVEYSYYTIDVRGEVVATSIMRDITQRKFLEGELRESEERYRQLIETANDAIFIADANTGIIINANRKAEELLGKTHEEIIGMHQTQFHSKEDADHYGKIFKEHVQRGKGVILKDVFVCHKNGRKIPTEVSASVTNFRGKKIMQGIFRDITERRNAEKAIKEGKEFLESVIENSRDGIAITDAKGHILSVNNALVKMSNFSKEELIGKHSSILTIEDKDLRKRILKKAGELFENGFTSFESKHKAREGGYIDVECSNAMIRDSEGNYFAGVSIIRDITERKKEEQKIIKYQKQLKSLTSELIISEQKERQYFADFLHDEIGQQLFATRLQIEQLKGSLSSAENIDTLNKALQNLYQVMNQTRSLTTELSSPILKQLGLEKALEWLAEQEHKKYDIMVTFEDDKREKPLDDNMKILLYQTVSELLTNVAKHAQVKNASVSIKKDDTDVRICVEDNGVGFNPQSKDSLDADIDGFGLFRIKERLESLGGQLKIESQPNRGTNITLVVPLTSSVDNIPTT